MPGQPHCPGGGGGGRCYGLNSVKLKPVTEEKPKAVEPEVPQPAPAPQTEAPKAQEEQPAAASAQPQKPQEPQDAFARAEAIRAAALKKVKRAAPSASGKKGEKKDNGRAIFGKVIKRAPVPIGELELDMGMVVIEGDVFAIENRELKKRNSWVVAFDVTDYTSSIRVSKFFPQADEAKPLVDGIKKGMHLVIQGRLNMDRFYGDMVLEPVAVMAGKKEMRMDNAPEKRVELHLHTTMSAMDALTAVGPKLGPERNVVKRAEAWGHRPSPSPITV